MVRANSEDMALYCLLTHLAFFSISVFQDLSNTPFQHNGLFFNLKWKSLPQKLRDQRINLYKSVFYHIKSQVSEQGIPSFDDHCSLVGRVLNCITGSNPALSVVSHHCATHLFFIA